MRYLPVGDVKRHSVDDIEVTLKVEQKFTRHSVPHLASAIVAASDELAAVLVKRTVSQGQLMRLQSFKQAEALIHVLALLLDESLDKLLELGFAGLGDQGLLQEDLVNQAINVSPTIREQTAQVRRKF